MPAQHPKGGAPFRVESNVELLRNNLNGKEYVFDDTPIFRMKYDENAEKVSCNNERYFPYETCKKDQSYSVCILQQGVLPGPFYPTTNSTLKISIRSKYELPRIYSSTTFYLHARIQICSNQPTKQVIVTNHFKIRCELLFCYRLNRGKQGSPC